MDDVSPLDGPSACAWSVRDTAKEKGVPFFDLTVNGPGPSHVKEEDDGGAWSSGGAGSSGGVKEEVKEEEEDPYYAIRRRYRGQ